MDTTTLKPGLLVSLKTTVTGNVTYRKNVLEQEHVTEDGAMLARWETERMISDPAEHETAVKVRSKARALITGVCAQSTFGLLCPEANASNLEAAIREARTVTEAFNETARLTHVTVHVIAGRVAADDVEATRAINSEVAGLLEIMQNGIKNLDVTAVREAAIKAKSIGSMLTPAASERVKGAIDAARAAARKIAKAGETVGQEVDLQAMNIVATARTAFLDMDEQAEIGQVDEEARSVDLAPEISDEQFAEIEAEHAETVAGDMAVELATMVVEADVITAADIEMELEREANEVPAAPAPQFEIE